MRFRPSQGLDNIYVHYYANIHSAYGGEQVLLTYFKANNYFSAKPTGTLTTSPTQITYSKMILLSGDTEQLITCIRSTQDYTDPMTVGLDVSLVTPHSVSSCLTRLCSGNSTSPSSLLPHLLESEIKVLSQALMKYGFLIKYSRMRKSGHYSPLKLITFLITIKNGTQVEKTHSSLNTRHQLPSSLTMTLTLLLVDISLEI